MDQQRSFFGPNLLQGYSEPPELRLRKLFPEFMPGRAFWIDHQVNAITKAYPEATPKVDQISEELYLGHLLEIRDALRTVWKEVDVRRREWLLFRLSHHLMEREDPRFAHAAGLIRGPGLDLIDKLPPPSPFEQALMLFLRLADRACFCGNPDCPAPFFLAKRRSQRYCSDACSKPAQREYKKKWWDEHGKDWREGRKAKKAKRRR